MCLTLLGQPKLVIELFRHGARGPLSSSEHYWKDAIGQLTTVGKAQHYVLGASLIQRYPQFRDILSQEHKVYYRTTDYNRTRESLEYHLLGMSEAPTINIDDLPLYENTFNSHFKEHAIYENFKKTKPNKLPQIMNRIQMMPFKQDLELLSSEIKTCPNAPYNVVNRENENRLAEDMIPMCDEVYKHLGVRLIDGQDLRYFYDVLVVNSYEGRALPSGITPEFWNYLKNAGEYFLTCKRFGDIRQTKLFSVFLLNYMLDFLNAKTREELSYDLVLLSAHDVTIFNFLNALNILTPKMIRDKIFDSSLEIPVFPNFASQLLIELWEADNADKHFIRVIYENSPLKIGQSEQEFIELSKFEDYIHRCYSPYTKEDVYGKYGFERIRPEIQKGNLAKSTRYFFL